MSNITAILAIPEIDEISINHAKKLFLGYKEKGIITNSNFSDSLWNLNNETSGFYFSFEFDEKKFKDFGDKFNISLDDFILYLKTYIVSQMGALSLGTLRNFIHLIKQLTYCDINSEKELMEIIAFRHLNQLSDFFTLIPTKNRESQLNSLMERIDDITDKMYVNKKGNKRSLATFESYFRFDEIIKRFWAETTDIEEKLFFFPIWMWWNVSGVIPLRPCEIVVTPRNCITLAGDKYMLSVRRNKIKGSSKNVTYTINGDYEVNRYIIPEKLAKEILWYIDCTSNYPEELTHTLFVTDTHYAKWDRTAPYTSRCFSYMNFQTCLRYFFKLIVNERYGYEVIYNNDETVLPNDKCIEYLHLGDTRHIALINLIAEGATPMVAMMLAGHDNPEMSSHYYSNISQLIECRTYRMFKKRIKGKQTYTLSKREDKLPTKDFLPLDNGGKCCSSNVAKGDFSDCYQVMGPSGEIGFCKSCKYYRSNSKAFTDERNIYINQLKNECDLLDDIVKRVRDGKGETEEITSVLLRIRDIDYSYQQYLLEKMEDEQNAKR